MRTIDGDIYSSMVSLVIPTRNSARTLEKCLKSIRSQTYPHIESIVVDRESTDETVEVAKRLADFVLQKGPERSAQRNYGISHARGEYVVIIDSDMILSPEVVEAGVRKMRENDRYVGLVIPERSFGKGYWAKCKAFERSFYVGVDWMEAARFFRKDVLDVVGGYNEALVSGEDWELADRISKKGDIGRIDEYIMHDEGRLTLADTIRKKAYYAGEIARYFDRGFSTERRKNNRSPLKRYRLLFSDPRRLLHHPFLTPGVFLMKTAEFTAGGLGYMWVRLRERLSSLSRKDGQKEERPVLTRAIILGAGQGKRMGDLTRETSKLLVDLGDGTCCLGRLVTNIADTEMFGETVVVVGHQAGRMRHYLAGLPGGYAIKTVFDPDYGYGSPVVSLAKVRDLMLSDDFLITNGDNVFRSGVLDVLQAPEWSEDGMALLVVDRDRFAADEMRVRCDAGGHLLEVGKGLPAATCSAASAGVVLMRGARARRAFVREIDRVVGDVSGPPTNIFWHSILSRLAEQGHRIRLVRIDGRSWAEVDERAELVGARKVTETDKKSQA